MGNTWSLCASIVALCRLKIAQAVAEISLFSRCFAAVFPLLSGAGFRGKASRISSLGETNCEISLETAAGEGGPHRPGYWAAAAAGRIARLNSGVPLGPRGNGL